MIQFKNIVPQCLLLVLALMLPGISRSEEPIVLAPLFAVPEVPPEYSTLEQRSNYLMANYWRNMDFSKKAVDQYRLNEAVYLYLIPMQWAAPEITDKSVGALLKQLKKNPGLQIQFTKAMEETCYGDRARLNADRVYLKFVDALLANGKVPELRKARYRLHHDRLVATLPGDPMPEFDYTDRFGASKRFSSPGVPAILLFGYPDCDDCLLVRLTLGTDVRANDASGQGLVKFMYIIPETSDFSWSAAVADYPSDWEVGASSGLEDSLDLRTRPSIYLLDSEGKIVAKNVPVEAALSFARETLINKN